MKTLKVRGVVLKEYETGEADKRILLLCKEHGRIMAYARGARKPRSKFMGASQIFTYSDFVLAQGRGFFSVAQADVIESFYELRTDYDTLCEAHFITSVCEKTLLENSNSDEILLLLLKSLSFLTKKIFPPKQITAVFLLKFFDYYGLRPTTDVCAVCGKKNDTGETGAIKDFYFWGKEGVLCEKHGGSFKISKAAMTAVSFILASDLPQSFSFEARKDILDEIHTAANLISENL